MLSTVRHVPDKHGKNVQDTHGISDRKSGKTAGKKDKTSVVMVIAGIVLLAIGLGFLGAYLIGRLFEHDPLKGVWNLDEVTVYSFNGKGHGELSLPLNSYDFDYVLEDNIIKIDFSDPETADRSYIYTVTESDLMLIDGEGNAFKFIRTGK